MASKFLPDEEIDLKVSYDYHGNTRTMVTDIPSSVLHSFGYLDFEEYIKQVRKYLILYLLYTCYPETANATKNKQHR